MANQILKGDGKAILIGFIGLIITIVFLITIANSNIDLVTTGTKVNETATVPANNTAIDIDGRELISITAITNNSVGAITPVNITLRTATSSTTGLRTVQLFNNVSSNSTGGVVNISYTYRPDGYLNNSGARSIERLVIIIGSLAILIFIIVVFIKYGYLGNYMRKK